ncbi:carbohydrate ABC transporter permease [Paraburkholderia sp. DHOC27]|uniref:carbohydrate ABC transporter permease n=1 Tax=Paraburkholderia sp. DHOC27 TaxID=2303330 RepID=UPI000E3CAE52|nr:sugar ABC transporter permease [Paraburkholderia sp. DHOC27]RFU45646.1 sugar ABC transporter permease [Paraburkholderia sp. DHOC27]
MNEHDNRSAQLAGVVQSPSRMSCALTRADNEAVRPRAFLWPETPAAYLLLAPVLILFGLAVAYPLMDTIRLSFFDIRGLGAAHYVGFGNYVALFHDANFRQALWTTLIWTVSTTLLSVGTGWLLALLCSLAPKATLIPRVMIFSAYGISEAVTGFIWLGIFRPDSGGLLNAGLAAIGLGQFSHAWLGDRSTALGALVIAYSWAQAGLPLMLCFAATQAIPSAIVEAACLDGARGFSLLRYIVMPLSLPGVRVATFINLLGSLRAFDTIFIMTNGGPVRSTETLGFFMYRESMLQFKLGYGAAATLVLLAAVLIVSVPVMLRHCAEAK